MTPQGLIQLLVMTVCAVAVQTASAAQPAALQWLCAQGADEAYSIVCVPVAAHGDGPDEPETIPGSTGRRDLRPVAMRGAAEIFGVDAWYVPLYGPPTDPDGVRELLRAVLCGKRAECVVRYEDAAPLPGLQARAR